MQFHSYLYSSTKEYIGDISDIYYSLSNRFAMANKEKLSTFAKVGPWFLLLLSLFHIGKEILQIRYLGIHYFKEAVNYLEIILYTSTILFIVPFIAETVTESIDEESEPWKSMKWNAGSVAVLLAWSNLLLYLKRFPFFGLYVVMFVEVCKSLISVLPLFSIFIIGFALSFYVLMDGEDAFKYIGRSIMKTGVMTIGEFEFNSIFTDYYGGPGQIDKKVLPHPIITYIIFMVFLVLMPILTMNFLVCFLIVLVLFLYAQFIREELLIPSRHTTSEQRCYDVVLRF